MSRKRCRSRSSPRGSCRVEADQCDDLGEAALGYRETKRERRAGPADAFLDANPLQVAVEVERTHADAGRPDVYRDLAVAEMWRIDLSREPAPTIGILELQRPGGRGVADRSTVLPGLTAAQIARGARGGRHGWRRGCPWAARECRHCRKGVAAPAGRCRSRVLMRVGVGSPRAGIAACRAQDLSSLGLTPFMVVNGVTRHRHSAASSSPKGK